MTIYRQFSFWFYWKRRDIVSLLSFMLPFYQSFFNVPRFWVLVYCCVEIPGKNHFDIWKQLVLSVFISMDCQLSYFQCQNYVCNSVHRAVESEGFRKEFWNPQYWENMDDYIENMGGMGVHPEIWGWNPSLGGGAFWGCTHIWFFFWKHCLMIWFSPLFCFHYFTRMI